MSISLPDSPLSKPPPPPPPPTRATTITTNTTITSLITNNAPLTQEPETASPAGVQDSNACVLASTLSATAVILLFLISGLVYYFYKRRQKHSIPDMRMTKNGPDLPTKLGRTQESTDFPCNQGFQSDKEYSVPPNREQPLPRKKGGKKDVQPISPYHAALANPEDYSVPPTRNDSIVEPPLPPNMLRKMQQKKEKKPPPPRLEEDSNSTYLDMDGITDDFYQNVSGTTTQDDIYINH